jgi:hypothetical protein
LKQVFAGIQVIGFQRKNPVVGSGPAGRILTVVLVGVHLESKGQLTHLADAFDFVGGLLGANDRRQEQRRENADDGDNNQEFDQRETPVSPPLCLSLCPHSCA